MTLGAGLFPAGAGYAGGTAIPPTADNPGPSDGVAFVDQNGDYQVNGTGDLVKTTPTKQRALLLLRTELKSNASDDSIGFATPRAIDASWDYRMRRAAEKALYPMTNDGTIRITRIDITRPLPFRASMTVTYIVLATGLEESATV